MNYFYRNGNLRGDRHTYKDNIITIYHKGDIVSRFIAVTLEIEELEGETYGNIKDL